MLLDFCGDCRVGASVSVAADADAFFILSLMPALAGIEPIRICYPTVAAVRITQDLGCDSLSKQLG